MKINLLRVFVEIDSFKGILFTGKLVKSILIRACPWLEESFKPSKGPVPKLLHVSPLFRVTGNRGIECVYSYARCKQRGYFVKCDGPPIPVVLGGNYYFYFGFHEFSTSSSKVLDALLSYRDCFEFMGQRVCIGVEGLDVYNPHSVSLDLARRVLETGGLKVKFSSPTMLRDPLKPRGKHKTLLPSVFNVFATPVYAWLYASGRYTKGCLRRELLRLHRLLGETYSVLGGVRVKWIYYSSKPEPALIGYVNYRVNQDYLEYLKSRMNVEEWLSEVFAYTLTLGVGAGRATGFGHVEITPIKKPISKETGDNREKS